MDMVVVSGRVKPHLNGIMDLLDTEFLILDSSVSRFQAMQWKKTCESLSIPYWSVAEKGAFVLRL